jgi:hypothetical protein
MGKPEGMKPRGSPRCGREEILRWILGRYNGVVWAGLIWLIVGTSGMFLRT